MQKMQPSSEEKPEPKLPLSPVSRAILNFAPSWFQVVMSTGIISILLHIAPHKFPGMATIGTIFYVANVCLIVIFTAITIARFVMFPWAFGRMFRHPAQSLFLGTIPMGLATVCNATVLIAVPAYGQWARDLAWALWWLDVVLSVLSTCVMPTIMFELQKHSIETMTRAWFLPIVPCVVAAALSGEVASVLPRTHALITLIIGYVLWGIGVSMSFLIMGLYLHRMASYHHLPNPEAMGSAFVPVGPCGQGAYGLILIVQAGQTVFSESDFGGQADSGRLIMVFSTVVAIMVWGVGVWWLVHGTLWVLLRVRSDKFRLSTGWWSWIFPLGVMAAGTVKLGEAVPSAFFAYLSLVMIACVFILYILVAFVTLKAFWHGSLPQSPCMSNLTHWHGINEVGRRAGIDSSRMFRYASM